MMLRNMGGSRGGDISAFQECSGIQECKCGNDVHLPRICWTGNALKMGKKLLFSTLWFG